MLASAGEVAADLEVAVNDEVKLLNRQAQSRARRAVNIMRNSAFDVLGKDGHGRRYGKHTASAPGEAPAPDTGNLRRNWRQYVLAKTVLDGVEITCRLKSDEPYAPLLEEGTSHMRPRPFRQRIIDKSMPDIDAIYGKMGG